MIEPAQAPAAHPDRLSLHQGLRTAVAAGLAYWLTMLLHLPAGYWAAISAIVVMQSQVGATLIASRDRLAGTAIGSLVGLLTAMVWHQSIAVFALGVLVVMVLCTALHLQNAGRLHGGVAVAIIVLIPRDQSIWHIAVERFLEVSFGIIVSLAVAVAGRKSVPCFRPKPRRERCPGFSRCKPAASEARLAVIARPAPSACGNVPLPNADHRPAARSSSAWQNCDGLSFPAAM